MWLQRVVTTKLPTPLAEFTLHGFEDHNTGEEYLALTLGNIAETSPVICRIHSECLTGEVLHSMRCDCGPQLDFAMKQIADVGTGVLLYLRQEGRGIGLLNKLRAYELQDLGADTVEANEQLGFAIDLRRFDMCGAMLTELGVSNVRLITNNPDKLKALTATGINVVERLPTPCAANIHNLNYLAVKASKLGHLLEVND